MTKRTKKFLIVLFCLAFVWGFLRFVIGGPEDDWICVEGEWIKHGQPRASKPETGCGLKEPPESSEEPEQSVGLIENVVKEKPPEKSAEQKDYEDYLDERVEEFPSLPELSPVEIKEIIAAGVNWLKQSQESSGHFRYEYSPLADNYSENDLMVRQTGVLYILGEILRKDRGEKYDLKENIEKAIEYFEENSSTGHMNGYNFRCVLRASKICSLGGTGLALIGILDLVDVYPELRSKYRYLIDDYLNFILAMKKPDEGFRGWYYLEGGQSEEESDFSNGEAFLTLARYYKDNLHMSSMKIKEVETVIDEAFECFNNKYGQARDYNFYLWGMAAIKDLSAYEARKEYFDFVKPYTDWRISGYRDRRDSIYNYCAYVEGVISAYSVMENFITEKEKEYYLEEINYWLSKSKDLQVDNSGFVDLVFGGKGYRAIVLSPKKAAGGFLTSLDNPFQRIDYTQHCLSSYLQKLVDIDNGTLN